MGSRASNFFVCFDRVVEHIQGFEKIVATEDGFSTGVGIQVARASRRLLKHPPPMPRGLLSWSPTVDHRGRGPLATSTGPSFSRCSNRPARLTRTLGRELSGVSIKWTLVIDRFGPKQTFDRTLASASYQLRKSALGGNHGVPPTSIDQPRAPEMDPIRPL
jgi:hypothetical protein